MAHFVVVGDDIAGTAAALALAEMGKSVTSLPALNDVCIADMWRIGHTPFIPVSMSAVAWYHRRYEWIRDSNVRAGSNTPDIPPWCGYVEHDAQTGEIILSVDPDFPSVRATAVIYTCTGSSPAPRSDLEPDRFFAKNLSWSAWSDGTYFRNRPVAVLGCGAHAAEQACILAHFASNVVVLCEEPEFIVPTGLSEVTQLPNVRINPGVCVHALVPTADGSITSVEVRRDGASESIDVGAVFVAYDPELSWEVWGDRERALELVKRQRLYLAGVPAGVPYRDHYALFTDGGRAAREAVERWG